MGSRALKHTKQICSSSIIGSEVFLPFYRPWGEKDFLRLQLVPWDVAILWMQGSNACFSDKQLFPSLTPVLDGTALGKIPSTVLDPGRWLLCPSPVQYASVTAQWKWVGEQEEGASSNSVESCAGPVYLVSACSLSKSGLGIATSFPSWQPCPSVSRVNTQETCNSKGGGREGKRGPSWEGCPCPLFLSSLWNGRRKEKRLLFPVGSLIPFWSPYFLSI